MTPTTTSINYDEPIDFDELAMRDAAFADIYQKSGGKLDFQDPKALQQLTTTLLKRDFDIQIELPDDRLCPPVPVRYNYVRWIKSLLDSTSDDLGSGDATPARDVVGLDIGTGATAIYPLLATSTHPNWTMYCTEIDRKSFDYATKNIFLNKLTSRIHAQFTESNTEPLIPRDALPNKVDFTMCNPPFYSSAEDFAMSQASKAAKPSAVCTGAETEMICPDGDIGFVLRILDESLVLRDRIQWYTSMFGKLSSVYKLVAKLKEASITNWAVTVLNKTGRTQRWVVGWSFGDRRPSWQVCGDGDVPNALRPHPTAHIVQTYPLDRADLVRLLDTCLVPLAPHGLDWTWDGETNIGRGSSKSVAWSPRLLRKRNRAQMEAESAPGDDIPGTVVIPNVDAPVILGFQISICMSNGEPVHLEICWLRGSDAVIYNSLCAMFRNKIKAAGKEKDRAKSKAKLGASSPSEQRIKLERRMKEKEDSTINAS